MSNLFLLKGVLAGFFLLQCLFYVMAAAGYVLEKRKHPAKTLFLIPFYFCMINGAALLALAKNLTRKTDALLGEGPMIAAIVAGGKGTRLKDVSGEIPKPMVPVGGKPVLQHQVELLARWGAREIHILTGYLGHVIEEHFGDGHRFGLSILYHREASPLGTAGCVAPLADLVGEPLYPLRRHHAGHEARRLCRLSPGNGERGNPCRPAQRSPLRQRPRGSG